MKRIGILLFVAIAAAVFTQSTQAHGRGRTQYPDRWAARHAQGMSWHGNYYHTATGSPVALIVPPISHMQTKWAWGVSQGTMTPIYHQFRRPFSGGGESGGGELNGTPTWPSHSDHFGVNYIRGPW